MSRITAIFHIYFSLQNLDAMFKAGLYINDLSMHDSSRDLILAGTQQSAELKLALDQVWHLLKLMILGFKCLMDNGLGNSYYIMNSNMTSFFRFVDKRAIYRWYNLIRTCAGECDWLFSRKCTSWWIIVCSNLAAYIVCDIFRKRKYKLPSSNQSILLYLYS